MILNKQSYEIKCGARTMARHRQLRRPSDHQVLQQATQ